MVRFFYIIIALLFTTAVISCDKEYYDINDINYEVVVPDTICLDSTISIKGSINQPLDIKVYFQDLRNESLIGVLKPHSDSFSWKPSNIPEGKYALCLRVDFKSKKGSGGGMVNYKSVYIKE